MRYMLGSDILRMMANANRKAGYVEYASSLNSMAAILEGEEKALKETEENT